ncbi:riboflavin synthase subunit alpha [Crocosphaera sp. UHCC 0190]|uniref:riboflavin synthase subunit alpha n=1 Tax=Crocosphaera sp. UHCC 0190 TaxID=3110246 RepID=UPI002B1F799F|nr:riboflavin synthase subunit alpha [Crocosphaera sp. UHCC 0190]MEA5512299.1 riboflavin synthase subunit alpha [Crocosphaera sp. UHCC 0190]
MLTISLITLTIASLSAFLSLNITEDVAKVAMGCIALLSFLLTLLFAPWPLKLSIVAIPLIIDRLNSRTERKSAN